MRLKLCWKPCAGSPARREFISPFCTAADEGISGRGTAKRDDFNRLIADCKKGKIDRIITKSVSRFARNTVDCLQTVRMLSKLGVTVCFEKEHIDTAYMTSEVILALSGTQAQDESVSHGNNMKWSYTNAMKSGNFLGTVATYGYTLINRSTVIINEEEAKVVRMIKDMYLSGMGLQKIVEAIREVVHDDGCQLAIKNLQSHIRMYYGGNDDNSLVADELRLNQLIAEVMNRAKQSDANSDEFLALSQEIDETKKRIAEKKEQQMSAHANEARMNEVLGTLDALKNHPIDYDDSITRKLIDCIKVVSKNELLVIFKGGIEKTVRME